MKSIVPESGRSSKSWFTFKIAEIPRLSPGQSHEQRTPHRSSLWVPEAHALGPSTATFLGRVLARSCIESGAVGAWSRILIWDAWIGCSTMSVCLYRVGSFIHLTRLLNVFVFFISDVHNLWFMKYACGEGRWGRWCLWCMMSAWFPCP